MGMMRTGKNADGYADNTPAAAMRNIYIREKQKDAEAMDRIKVLIPMMKQIAELAGFEVVGRIGLKDKSTGKEWK